MLKLGPLGLDGSGKPMVYDSKTDHFILGTTDKKMLVLNAKDGSVLASIPVQGPVDETVIDEGPRRVFGADKAGVVEVIDLDQNKVVATIPSEKNAHTLAVEPKTHHLFVSLNEGNTVAVFTPSM